VAEQALLLCHGGRGASVAAPWPLHKMNPSSGERKREERKRGDKKEKIKKDAKVVAEMKERTGQKIRILRAAVNRFFNGVRVAVILICGYPALTSKILPPCLNFVCQLVTSADTKNKIP
jgi:hypothetical protein